MFICTYILSDYTMPRQFFIIIAIYIYMNQIPTCVVLRLGSIFTVWNGTRVMPTRSLIGQL